MLVTRAAWTVTGDSAEGGIAAAAQGSDSDLTPAILPVFVTRLEVRRVEIEPLAAAPGFAELGSPERVVVAPISVEPIE
jgi:hypothetical protein